MYQFNLHSNKTLNELFYKFHDNDDCYTVTVAWQHHLNFVFQAVITQCHIGTRGLKNPTLNHGFTNF